MRKANPGTPELEDYLITKREFVCIAKPRTEVEAVALAYMLVLILMSMGLHHGKKTGWFGGPTAWKQHLADAERKCEDAFAVADRALETEDEGEDRDMLVRLRPFLFINWIQLILEQAKLRYRRTIREALELLRDRDALAAVRQFLADKSVPLASSLQRP